MSTPIKESRAGLLDNVPAQGAAKKSRGGAADPAGGEGRVLNVFSHGFLALWAVLIVLPLIWIILGAFKNDAEIGASAWTWPSHWGLDAFTRAWDKGIGDFFVNTVIVMVFSVPLTMLFGSMAAYVLA